MVDARTSTSTSSKYPELYTPIIWTSLWLAILGGFGLAGHLSFIIGFGLPPGLSFLALIQAHGHLQLFGWMGMLLLGVSMYVLPRLTSNSSGLASSRGHVFRFALAGVLLRTLPLISAGYLPPGWRPLCHGFALLGAVLQAFAIGIYLHFIISGVRRRVVDQHDLARLAPYFLPMILGWVLFAGGELALVGSLALNLTTSSTLWWAALHQEAFIRLVIVQAILGFGIKMLPIFLGIRPPLWPVRRIGWLLAVSTFAYFICKGVGGLTSTADEWLGTIQALSSLVFATTILWYVWELDALLFRVRPERVSLKVFRSDSGAQRGRFGDRGEFGRFEFFVIAGFAWLVLFALAEGANAISSLFHDTAVLSPTILKHMLVLGFASHLILGVGHRLLPNLLHTPLRNPKLTLVCFLLLSIAAISRVLPPMLGELAIEGPWQSLPQYIFGVSGLFGLLAMVVFGFNLRGRPLSRSAPS